MSSGFVTETELAEARQRRQEEWEKVRTAEQPEVRPEEPYDGRTLFDRLKEQKMAKDLEYEETHKLKNMIRGLDDDEAQFLEMVDKTKCEAERQQVREEQQELKDFRERVATLQEETMDRKIKSEVRDVNNKSKPNASAQRTSQRALLGVAIKRRNGDTNAATAVAASSSSSSSSATTTTSPSAAKQPKLSNSATPTTPPVAAPFESITTKQFDQGELRCIAILPGMGTYTESSDSELSSGSDDDPETTQRYDLVGRKQQKKKQCQEE